MTGEEEVQQWVCSLYARATNSGTRQLTLNVRLHSEAVWRATHYNREAHSNRIPDNSTVSTTQSSVFHIPWSCQTAWEHDTPEQRCPGHCNSTNFSVAVRDTASTAITVSLPRINCCHYQTAVERSQMSLLLCLAAVSCWAAFQMQPGREGQTRSKWHLCVVASSSQLP